MFAGVCWSQRRAGSLEQTTVHSPSTWKGLCTVVCIVAVVTVVLVDFCSGDGSCIEALCCNFLGKKDDTVIHHFIWWGKMHVQYSICYQSNVKLEKHSSIFK